MDNNAADFEKSPTESCAEEILMPSPAHSENLMMFQVFFLTTDDSKSVEVVETEEIDFGEIVQRLKMGEKYLYCLRDAGLITGPEGLDNMFHTTEKGINYLHQFASLKRYIEKPIFG